MTMVFFNISWMTHYRGDKNDKCYGGGSHINDYRIGHEILIFCRLGIVVMILLDRFVQITLSQ